MWNPCSSKPFRALWPHLWACGWTSASHQDARFYDWTLRLKYTQVLLGNARNALPFTHGSIFHPCLVMTQMKVDAPVPSIFIYFHLFSSIFIYFHLFSSMFIYFHLFSSIFIYFHLFSTCQFYQWPKWDRHQHGMILKKWVAHGPLEPSCWASLTWDFGHQSLRQCGPDHRGDTWGIDKLDHLLNGNSRILNWRYVSTIFGHILWGYSLKLRPEK